MEFDFSRGIRTHCGDHLPSHFRIGSKRGRGIGQNLLGDESQTKDAFLLVVLVAAVMRGFGWRHRQQMTRARFRNCQQIIFFYYSSSQDSDLVRSSASVFCQFQHPSGDMVASEDIASAFIPSASYGIASKLAPVRLHARSIRWGRAWSYIKRSFLVHYIHP